MSNFIELTPTTMPSKQKQLRVAIDAIESYRSANPRDTYESAVRMKSSEIHYVDESVASIDHRIALASGEIK